MIRLGFILLFQTDYLKAFTYIIAVLLFISCNNEALENCKNENEILRNEKSKREEIIDNLTATYSKLDSASLVIAKKKARINELASKNPMTEEDKKEILSEMDSINLILQENKSNVQSLQSNMNQGGLEKGFRYMVQSMDEKNQSEDEMIIEVKKDLAQISQDFSDLFEEYIYKEVENMEIRDQLSSKEAELQAAQEKLSAAKEELHAGYYIIGTKEELDEKGLIYRKGLFDIKEVNKDFDKNLFKKVDILELKEILLDARYAEIMTTHPSESYEIKGIKKKVNKLLIKEPELFWSVSKFLIVEIEN